MFQKFILILLVSFFAFGFAGSADKIDFLDASLKKVVKKAKNDNKLVFIFVGSEHCDLCLRTKETFHNKEVAELYNAKYINTLINPDKVYNNMRLTNWGVSQIPYLIFMDTHKRIIYKVGGQQTYLTMLKHGRAALDSFAVYEQRELDKKYKKK